MSSMHSLTIVKRKIFYNGVNGRSKYFPHKNVVWLGLQNIFLYLVEKNYFTSFCIIFSICLMSISLKYYKTQTKYWEIYIRIHVLCFIWLEWLWGWYEMTFYLGCKFKTCSQWKSSEFRTLIDVILNFYALHNSVWVDLWPYSNAYVRPGTRATPGVQLEHHVKSEFCTTRPKYREGRQLKSVKVFFKSIVKFQMGLIGMVSSS